MFLSRPLQPRHLLQESVLSSTHCVGARPSVSPHSSPHIDPVASVYALLMFFSCQGRFLNHTSVYPGPQIHLTEHQLDVGQSLFPRSWLSAPAVEHLLELEPSLFSKSGLSTQLLSPRPAVLNQSLEIRDETRTSLKRRDIAHLASDLTERHSEPATCRTQV